MSAFPLLEQWSPMRTKLWQRTRATNLYVISFIAILYPFEGLDVSIPLQFLLIVTAMYSEYVLVLSLVSS